jgi:hypothetical protein
VLVGAARWDCRCPSPGRLFRNWAVIRQRVIVSNEAQIRATAYALKVANRESIEVAAPAMAALVSGPCWLVPIPASDRSIKANLALARAVAALVPGSRVRTAIARSQRVASSTWRRRRGLPGLRREEHHFIRTAEPMTPVPVYFVDNVISTGGTVQAARAALGWGTGLTYAYASTPSTAGSTKLESHSAVQPRPLPAEPDSCRHRIPKGLCPEAPTLPPGYWIRGLRGPRLHGPRWAKDVRAAPWLGRRPAGAPAGFREGAEFRISRAASMEALPSPKVRRQKPAKSCRIVALAGV